MSRKQRPFTRKQRHRIMQARRDAERAAARECTTEAKDYASSLDMFRRCDPERTERLAEDG